MTSPLILETNIEKILEDHLSPEIELIDQKLTEIEEARQKYLDRRERLVKLAEVMGIEV